MKDYLKLAYDLLMILITTGAVILAINHVYNIKLEQDEYLKSNYQLDQKTEELLKYW